MNIGYACITVGLPCTGLRSCVQRSANEERLRTLIRHNLAVLERQVEYNIRWDIGLFRLSSDLIPFASSPVNALAWWEEFAADFARIGDRVAAARMRVSMHPGQYTVLSSPYADVAARAREDLLYHARVFDALGVGPECKIVLHLGGVYGDKPAAMGRFARHFAGLPEAVCRRLVVENDERCYHIADVLELAARLSIPAVYDNLHNSIHPADESKDDAFWIRQAAATWKPYDGRQKIHYAQQEPGKRPGAHAQRIRLPEFLSFVRSLEGLAPDTMLEVKDKDLSAAKCLTALSPERHIRLREREWARYRYLILERDPATYARICALLEGKDAYPVEDFYALLDRAMGKEATAETSANAALHLWDCFENRADGAEKKRFERSLARLRSGTLGAAAVKRELWKLAELYDERPLLESLYFTS